MLRGGQILRNNCKADSHLLSRLINCQRSSLGKVSWLSTVLYELQIALWIKKEKDPAPLLQSADNDSKSFAQDG